MHAAPGHSRLCRLLSLEASLVLTVILGACATTPGTDAGKGRDRPAPVVQTPHGSFLLTRVNVIPMDAERVIADGAVLVNDGVIEWVGPSREAPDPRDAVVVDGGGGYLFPGLADLHVHIGHPDELDLYLLNGVTTVANLSGRPDHLEMRDKVAAGTIRGPTIYTAGPTIDGDPPRNPRFVAVGGADQAAAVIGEQRGAGYDFVKIYDLIEHPAYAAATAAARTRGVAVVGHIPKAIGLEGILEGHDLVAHAEEFFYTYFANTDDRSRIPEAARLTAEAGLAVCPNTGFIRSIIEQAEDIDAVLALPQVRYLPPESLLSWLPESNRYLGRPREWLERNQRMYPFLLELTQAFHDAGVLLVTGSDAAVAGAVPGFSLHREIRELVTAGLPAWEALRAATANPGAWIGEHLQATAPPGVIAPGRRADLLLLGANPLNDLEALRDLRAVIARGRWIEHGELAAAVEGRATEYAHVMVPYRRFKEMIEQGSFEEAELLLSRGDSAVLNESVVNGLGYSYLYRREDPETAIALFAMNTRVYPESWNVWDSLGEGHMVAGEKELAIANYRKSLERNPDNTNGIRMLERLSEVGPDPLDTLAAWMSGSFSSQAQAEADEEYLDIRLEMVPIWTERDDGRWLYVEQAAATTLDRPYRQRVYRLSGQPDGLFRSEVYAIPDPLRFAGAWRDQHPLSELAPEDLELHKGCTVILRRVDDATFAGSTVGSDCSSTLRGASCATSEVKVTADRIESWDRGFTADGEQAWGAERGPYVFLKTKDY